MERTLSIIKPDAVAAGKVGEILTRIERAGFRVVGLRMRHLDRAQAEAFYAVHRGQPFYDRLCNFMSSGSCVALLLEREDAILTLRGLMGATNPNEAQPGTIRKDFASSSLQNAIHGSDAVDSARVEIGYFFAGCDLV